MIPYGKQAITTEDISSVVEILQSEYLTQGPTVPLFEDKIAKYVHAKFAVAVNSATSALHLACLALEVGPGSLVWTSPISFVASANCALYCGGSIDFVDIDPKTYNISVQALSKKLEFSKKNNCLPKVLIVVHLAGQSSDMQAIGKLSKRYGFKIIEDASHAVGAKYLNAYIGNCQYSDVTIFSFHPVKIITTGEGGMAVTNQEGLAKKMRLLRSHGITREKNDFIGESRFSWGYEQQFLGFNYRLTDIQAALGISQFNNIDANISARHSIAKIYDEALSSLPLVLPWQHPDSFSSYHLYIIKIDQEKTTHSRERIFNILRDSNVGVNVHYIPIHTQPYYRALGFLEADFPNAMQYYKDAITLPIFPALTKNDQLHVINVLMQALG